MAVVVQAKTRGDSQRPIRRQIPNQDGRKVVGSVEKAKAVAITEATIHLDARSEVLRTEGAPLGSGRESQWAAHAHGIAKLPGRVRKILCGYRILRDIPAFDAAGKNKLRFDFLLVFLSQGAVGRGKIGLNVVAFNLLQDFFGAIEILILYVQNGVDEVFALQWPHAILPANPGKCRAVAKGCLPVEIKRRRPPGLRSILELRPIAVEVVSAALRTEHGGVGNFQVARFLQVVVIGHKVGVLLGPAGWR